MGHTDRIRALAWSPDGTHLASAGTDHTIRIWDPTTEQTSTSLTSHTDDVNAVAWSPDGACLATASSDRTVRIWDTTTLQTTTTITAHTSRVRAVTWSPDGAHLATACDDGLIIFWSRQGTETTSIAMQTAFSLAWLDDLIAIGHVGPPTLVKLTHDRHADMSKPSL